jgi:hypothetical protein
MLGAKIIGDNMAEERKKVIEKFAKANGWTSGAELGVWRGRTFKYLLTNLPNLKLIGVDLYAPQPDNTGPEKWTPGENGHDWDHEGYFQDIAAFCKKVNGRGKLLRMKTSEAAKLIPDESLDFVFIDADHSYEGCNADIKNWGPKVKRGGYIMGHDIFWEGVNKAIKENFGNNYAQEEDKVWYHIKK